MKQQAPLPLSLLFLLLIVCIAHAQVQEFAFKTYISLSNANSTIYAKISYQNMSVYQPNVLEDGQPPNFYVPGQDEFSSDTMNLSNASLTFTFDGMGIVDAGGEQICNNTTTNQTGWASCKLEYFRNSAGGISSFGTYPSCGMVTVDYEGESRESDEFQPSLGTIMACPKSSPAISAFGTGISAAIQHNIAYCFPALIVLGLLIASMYYSGRDPLSLFDITTPRLPKGKPYRVSAGQAPMMLRSLGKSFTRLGRQSKLDISHNIDGYLRAYNATDRLSSREAKATRKREMRNDVLKLIREYRMLIEKAVRDPKVLKDVSTQNRLITIRETLRRSLAHYDPQKLRENLGDVDMHTSARIKHLEKLYKRLMGEGDEPGQIAGQLALYADTKLAGMQLGASRTNPGGRIRKGMTNAINKMTDWEIAADEKLKKVRIPIVGRPIRSILATPFKVFDVLAQHRASTLAARSVIQATMGGALGTMVYDEDGNLKSVPRALQRLVKKGEATNEAGEKTVQYTAFGKFLVKPYKWYYGKDKEPFDLEKYNVMKKQASTLRDDAENARYLVAHVLNGAVDAEIARVSVEGLGARDWLYAAAARMRAKKDLSQEEKDQIKAIMETIKKLKIYETASEEKRREIRDSTRNSLAAVSPAIRRAGLHALADKIDNYDPEMPIKAEKVLSNGQTTKAQKLEKLISLLGENDQNSLRRLGIINKGEYVRKFADWENRVKGYGVKVTGGTYEVETEGGLLGEARADVMNKKVVAGGKEARQEDAIREEVRRSNPTLSAVKQERMVQERIAAEAAGALELKKTNFQNTMKNSHVELEKELRSGKGGMISDIEDYTSQLNENARRNNSDFSEYIKRITPIRQHLAGAYLTESLRSVFFDGNGNIKKEIAPQGYVVLHGRNITRADEFRVDDVSDLEALFSKSSRPEMRQFRQMILAALRAKLFDGETREAVSEANITKNFKQYSKAMEKKADGWNKLPEEVRARKIAELKQKLLAQGIDWDSLLPQEQLKRMKDQAKQDARNEIRIDMVEQILLKRCIGRQQEFLTHLDRAEKLISGNKGKISKALMDALLEDSSKFIRKNAAPGESFEFAALRYETKLGDYMGKKEFGQNIEMLLDANRKYNRLAPFIFSINQRGGAWGDSVLGFLDSNHQEMRDSYNMQRVLYLNKMTDSSHLYDKEFHNKVTGLLRNKGMSDAEISNSIRNEAMPYEAYRELIRRGLTYADMKKIEFIRSTDMKGGIPVFEYDKKILSARYGNDAARNAVFGDAGIIIQKPKVSDGKGGYRYATPEELSNGRVAKIYDMRDLAYRFAKIQSSDYANAVVGFVADVKDEKTGKWKVGMPLQNAALYRLVGAAEASKNVRANAALAATGFNEKGEYNPELQKVKVYGSPDYYKRGMQTMSGGLGRFFYGAYADKQKKMHEYLAAQGIIRMVVSRYTSMAGKWTTEGEKRFDISETKYGGKTILQKLEAEELKKVEGKSPDEQKKWKDIYEKLRNKAEEIRYGQDGWLSTLRATYLNFRSSVASRVIDDIAETESTYIAKKKELQALNRLTMEERRQLKITDVDFESLKQELKKEKTDYRIEKHETRKDLKYLNESVVSWVGSHGQDYGSKRNIWTKWLIFTKLLDSEYRMGYGAELMYAVEAATMRSTQVAIGMSVTSFDQAMTVGLETGQGLYEPAHMWLNSGSWERNYKPYVAFSRAQHKATLPFVGKWYANMFGMPSYLQKTETESTGRGKRFVTLSMNFLQVHNMSDFFTTRINNIKDRTGISSMINAFIRTRSPTKVRSYLEKRYIASSHIHADAPGPEMLRYMDRFGEMDRIVEKNETLGNNLEKWRGETRPTEKENTWHSIILDNPDIKQQLEKWKSAPDSRKVNEELGLAIFRRTPAPTDLRPIEIKAAMRAGKSFYDDGSRNRFMNLYLAYHQNIWKPWVPGMTDVDPLTNMMESFPQVANLSRNAEGGPLALMRQAGFMSYGEGGHAESSDWLSMDKDAFRDVYRKDNMALLQLMKYQNDAISYVGLSPYTESFKRMFGGKKKQVPMTTEYQQYMEQTVGYATDDLDYIVSAQRARWMVEDMEKEQLKQGKAKWKKYIPLYNKIEGGFANKWEHFTSPETKHQLAAYPITKAAVFTTNLFKKDLEINYQFKSIMKGRNYTIAQNLIEAAKNTASADAASW